MSRVKKTKKPKPKRRKFRLTMKKYFKIPETPKTLPRINGEEYTFKACMTYIIDNEPRFNEKTSASRKGRHILDALDAEFEVDSVRWCEVEEDALSLLNSVLEEPKCGWHDQNMFMLGPPNPETGVSRPLVDHTGQPKALRLPTRLVIPYFDAPSEAVHEDPRKAKEKVEKTEKTENGETTADLS